MLPPITGQLPNRKDVLESALKSVEVKERAEIEI